MQGNRSRDTRPERIVRSAIHRRGLRFRKHARPVPSLAFKADVVFRTEKVAVAVDGCIWHGCPTHGMKPRTNRNYWTAKIARNVARDRRNEEALAEQGWPLLRAWEHEDAEDVAARVAEVVWSRRSG
jgi:DNA mismatch endonuclease, patch repair protein